MERVTKGGAAAGIPQIKYLLWVLLIISLGFLLLYSSFVDHNPVSSIRTSTGEPDIISYSVAPYPNAIYGVLFAALFLLAHAYMRVKLADADPFILPSVALLSGIGLIMMLRLSPDIAISRNAAPLVKLGIKHFINISAGILAMIITAELMNRRFLSWLSSKKYVWVVCSAGLILVTHYSGTKINGRSLWLFGFQTVELVKLLILFFIAGYIYEKGEGISLYRKNGFRHWVEYAAPFISMWLIALLPLFIQRDLGPTLLIFTVLVLMFHYAGNRHSITLYQWETP